MAAPQSWCFFLFLFFLGGLFSLWGLGVGAHYWAPFSISANETVLVNPEVEGTVTEIICLLGVAALSLLCWVVAWRCPV